MFIAFSNLCIGDHRIETHKFEVDILGEYAPTNMEIHYYKKDITELLNNKSIGHYLIYQGQDNNIHYPYTIFVNKISCADDESTVYFIDVGYDIESGHFSGCGSSYDSLQGLIDSLRDTLRHQIRGISNNLV